MQHVFLIRAVCGPGWIHMFGRFSIGRKQPICCNVSDVATATGTNLGESVTSCMFVDFENQVFFSFCSCVFFLGGKNISCHFVFRQRWILKTWRCHKCNSAKPPFSPRHGAESLWCQAQSGIFEDVLQLCQCLGGVFTHTHTHTHTLRHSCKGMISVSVVSEGCFLLLEWKIKLYCSFFLFLCSTVF